MQTDHSREGGGAPVASRELREVALMLFSILIGALTAVMVLPAWLPWLGASLAGAEPKAYWFLSRASGFAAFALLWVSMALGLSLTNKLARLWLGGPTAVDLHQFLSLLGLGFAFFHAAILLGDRYTHPTLLQLLMPFSAAAHRPFWVGLGQVGLYLMALVGLSFFVRRTIGHRLWRAIHFASFLIFLLALAHALLSGTDSATLWARVGYWASGGSLVFLTTYRLLIRYMMNM